MKLSPLHCLALLATLSCPLGCNGRPVVTQPEPGGGSGSGGDAADASDANSGGANGSDDAGNGSVGAACTSCGACEEQFDTPTAMHVTGTVEYEHTPPTSGDHNPCWGNWGVQDALPAENWVHNLEHGGVVLLHDCDGECEAELGELETFVADHERTLVTEYPGLGARFAIIAWGFRIVSDCWDEAAFNAFYDRHFAQGPENIPSGPPDSCNPE